MSDRTFFQKFGGRKNVNGYIYATLITGMAFPLKADFGTYSTALALALLGTSAIVAIEDHHKRKLGDGQ